MKQFSVISDIETGVPLAILVKDGRNVTAYGINEFGKDIINSSFHDGSFKSLDGLSQSQFRPMNEKVDRMLESALSSAPDTFSSAGKLAFFGKRFSERVTLSDISKKSTQPQQKPIEYRAQMFKSISAKSSVLTMVKNNKLKFNESINRFTSRTNETNIFPVNQIEKMMTNSSISRLGRALVENDAEKSIKRRVKRRAKSLQPESLEKSFSVKERVSKAIFAKIRRH